MPLMYWPHCGHSKTKSEHGQHSTACPQGRNATQSPTTPHARHRLSFSWKIVGKDDRRTKSRAGVPIVAKSARPSPPCLPTPSASNGSCSWCSSCRLRMRYCTRQQRQQSMESIATPALCCRARGLPGGVLRDDAVASRGRSFD